MKKVFFLMALMLSFVCTANAVESIDIGKQLTIEQVATMDYQTTQSDVINYESLDVGFNKPIIKDSKITLTQNEFIERISKQYDIPYVDVKRIRKRYGSATNFYEQLDEYIKLRT